MQPIVPDYIASVFVILSFMLLIIILYGFKKALIKSGVEEAKRKRKIRRLAMLLLLWLLFLVKISDMQFFHDWLAMPPRILIAVLPPLVGVLALIFSNKLNAIVSAIPQHSLILIQSFRIVMEIILLILFLEYIIPVQMTFEGRNFDILAGITALPVAYLVFKNKVSRNFIIGWNIFGLLLLANIVVVALLSTPIPFRYFMNEPANTVIAYFPFVWLPGFVVPVAYTMHFLSLKKCFSERK